MLIEMKVVLEYLLWESWLKILAAASGKTCEVPFCWVMQSLSSSQAAKQNQPTNQPTTVILSSILCHRLFLTYTTTLA
jgi:hypothetical protein